jgi:thiol-disulfide isomerase/thioredoxin
MMRVCCTLHDFGATHLFLSHKINHLRKELIRIIALLTALIFVVQNSVAYGQSFSPNIERVNQSMNTEVLKAQDLLLPESLAKVEKAFVPANGTTHPPILIIQDAHANYAIQMKIREILHYLDKNLERPIHLVLEGAPRNPRPDLFKIFSDPKTNLSISTSLMERGEFTGWERFLLEKLVGKTGSASETVSQKPVSYNGVEDANLYRRDWQMFKSVYRDEDRVKTWAEKTQRDIEKLATTEVSKDLMEFLSLWRLKKSERLDFKPYFEKLAKEVNSRLAIDLASPLWQKDYPMAVRLKVLLELETATAAEAEARTKEVTAIQKKMGEWKLSADYAPMFTESAAAKSVPVTKAGKPVPLRDLVESFYDEAKSHGFDFRDYPAASRYWGWRILGEELEAIKLFAEIQGLEQKLFEKLAVTEKEKEIVALYEDLDLLRSLLTLELTREDFGKLKATIARVAPETMQKRIADLLAAAKKARGHKQAAVKQPGSVARTFRNAIRFYKIAVLREAAMKTQIDEFLKGSDDSVPVMIAGGFHTAAMGTLLEKDSIPYVIVTPVANNISSLTEFEDARQRYITSMLEDSTRRVRKSQIPFFALTSTPDEADLFGVDSEYRLGEVSYVVTHTATVDQIESEFAGSAFAVANAPLFVSHTGGSGIFEKPITTLANALKPVDVSVTASTDSTIRVETREAITSAEPSAPTAARESSDESFRKFRRFLYLIPILSGLLSVFLRFYSPYLGHAGFKDAWFPTAVFAFSWIPLYFIKNDASISLVPRNLFTWVLSVPFYLGFSFAMWMNLHDQGYYRQHTEEHVPARLLPTMTTWAINALRNEDWGYLGQPENFLAHHRQFSNLMPLVKIVNDKHVESENHKAAMRSFVGLLIGLSSNDVDSLSADQLNQTQTAIITVLQIYPHYKIDRPGEYGSEEIAEVGGLLQTLARIPALVSEPVVKEARRISQDAKYDLQFRLDAVHLITETAKTHGYTLEDVEVLAPLLQYSQFAQGQMGILRSFRDVLRDPQTPSPVREAIVATSSEHVTANQYPETPAGSAAIIARVNIDQFNAEHPFVDRQTRQELRFSLRTLLLLILLLSVSFAWAPSQISKYYLNHPTAQMPRWLGYEPQVRAVAVEKIGKEGDQATLDNAAEYLIQHPSKESLVALAKLIQNGPLAVENRGTAVLSFVNYLINVKPDDEHAHFQGKFTDEQLREVKAAILAILKSMPQRTPGTNPGDFIGGYSGTDMGNIGIVLQDLHTFPSFVVLLQGDEIQGQIRKILKTRNFYDMEVRIQAIAALRDLPKALWRVEDVEALNTVINYNPFYQAAVTALEKAVADPNTTAEVRSAANTALQNRSTAQMPEPEPPSDQEMSAPEDIVPQPPSDFNGPVPEAVEVRQLNGQPNSNLLASVASQRYEMRAANRSGRFQFGLATALSFLFVGLLLLVWGINAGGKAVANYRYIDSVGYKKPPTYVYYSWKYDSKLARWLFERPAIQYMKNVLSSDEDPARRMGAANGLKEMVGPSAFDDLSLALSKETDPIVKTELIKNLKPLLEARRDDPAVSSAIALIQSALEDKDYQVRSAAVDVLLDVPSTNSLPEVQAALRKLLKEDLPFHKHQSLLYRVARIQHPEDATVEAVMASFRVTKGDCSASARVLGQIANNARTPAMRTAIVQVLQSRLEEERAIYEQLVSSSADVIRRHQESTHESTREEKEHIYPWRRSLSSVNAILLQLLKIAPDLGDLKAAEAEQRKHLSDPLEAFEVQEAFRFLSQIFRMEIPGYRPDAETLRLIGAIFAPSFDGMWDRDENGGRALIETPQGNFWGTHRQYNQYTAAGLILRPLIQFPNPEVSTAAQSAYNVIAFSPASAGLEKDTREDSARREMRTQEEQGLSGIQTAAALIGFAGLLSGYYLASLLATLIFTTLEIGKITPFRSGRHVLMLVALLLNAMVLGGYMNDRFMHTDKSHEPVAVSPDTDDVPFRGTFLDTPTAEPLIQDESGGLQPDLNRPIPGQNLEALSGTPVMEPFDPYGDGNGGIFQSPAYALDALQHATTRETLEQAITYLRSKEYDEREIIQTINNRLKQTEPLAPSVRAALTDLLDTLHPAPLSAEPSGSKRTEMRKDDSQKPAGKAWYGRPSGIATIVLSAATAFLSVVTVPTAAFLYWLLPPMLALAAIRTAYVSFRQNRNQYALLALLGVMAIVGPSCLLTRVLISRYIAAVIADGLTLRQSMPASDAAQLHSDFRDPRNFGNVIDGFLTIINNPKLYDLDKRIDAMQQLRSARRDVAANRGKILRGLIKALGDAAPLIRINAIDCLIDYIDSSSLGLLDNIIPLLKDPDVDVRNEASLEIVSFFRRGNMLQDQPKLAKFLATRFVGAFGQAVLDETLPGHKESLIVSFFDFAEELSESNDVSETVRKVLQKGGLNEYQRARAEQILEQNEQNIREREEEKQRDRDLPSGKPVPQGNWTRFYEPTEFLLAAASTSQSIRLEMRSPLRIALALAARSLAFAIWILKLDVGLLLKNIFSEAINVVVWMFLSLDTMAELFRKVVAYWANPSSERRDRFDEFFQGLPEDELLRQESNIYDRALVKMLRLVLELPETLEAERVLPYATLQERKQLLSELIVIANNAPGVAISEFNGIGNFGAWSRSLPETPIAFDAQQVRGAIKTNLADAFKKFKDIKNREIFQAALEDLLMGILPEQALPENDRHLVGSWLRDLANSMQKWDAGDLRDLLNQLIKIVNARYAKQHPQSLDADTPLLQVASLVHPTQYDDWLSKLPGDLSLAQDAVGVFFKQLLPELLFNRFERILRLMAEYQENSANTRGAITAAVNDIFTLLSQGETPLFDMTSDGDVATRDDIQARLAAMDIAEIAVLLDAMIEIINESHGTKPIARLENPADAEAWHAALPEAANIHADLAAVWNVVMRSVFPEDLAANLAGDATRPNFVESSVLVATAPVERGAKLDASQSAMLRQTYVVGIISLMRAIFNMDAGQAHGMNARLQGLETSQLLQLLQGILEAVNQDAAQQIGIPTSPEDFAVWRLRLPPSISCNHEAVQQLYDAAVLQAPGVIAPAQYRATDRLFGLAAGSLEALMGGNVADWLEKPLPVLQAAGRVELREDETDGQTSNIKRTLLIAAGAVAAVGAIIGGIIFLASTTTADTFAMWSGGIMMAFIFGFIFTIMGSESQKKGDRHYWEPGLGKAHGGPSEQEELRHEQAENARKLRVRLAMEQLRASQATTTLPIEDNRAEVVRETPSATAAGAANNLATAVEPRRQNVELAAPTALTIPPTQAVTRNPLTDTSRTETVLDPALFTFQFTTDTFGQATGVGESWTTSAEAVDRIDLPEQNEAAVPRPAELNVDAVPSGPALDTSATVAAPGDTPLAIALAEEQPSADHDTRITLTAGTAADTLGLNGDSFALPEEIKPVPAAIDDRPETPTVANGIDSASLEHVDELFALPSQTAQVPATVNANNVAPSAVTLETDAAVLGLEGFTEPTDDATNGPATVAAAVPVEAADLAEPAELVHSLSDVGSTAEARPETIPGDVERAGIPDAELDASALPNANAPASSVAAIAVANVAVDRENLIAAEPVLQEPESAAAPVAAGPARRDSPVALLFGGADEGVTVTPVISAAAPSAPRRANVVAETSPTPAAATDLLGFDWLAADNRTATDSRTALDNDIFGNLDLGPLVPDVELPGTLSPATLGASRTRPTQPLLRSVADRGRASATADVAAAPLLANAGLPTTTPVAAPAVEQLVRQVEQVEVPARSNLPELPSPAAEVPQVPADETVRPDLGVAADALTNVAALDHPVADDGLNIAPPVLNAEAPINLATDVPAVDGGLLAEPVNLASGGVVADELPQVDAATTELAPVAVEPSAAIDVPEPAIVADLQDPRLTGSVADFNAGATALPSNVVDASAFYVESGFPDNTTFSGITTTEDASPLPTTVTELAEPVSPELPAEPDILQQNVIGHVESPDLTAANNDGMTVTDGGSTLPATGSPTPQLIKDEEEAVITGTPKKPSGYFRPDGSAIMIPVFDEISLTTMIGAVLTQDQFTELMDNGTVDGLPFWRPENGQWHWLGEMLAQIRLPSDTTVSEGPPNDAPMVTPRPERPRIMGRRLQTLGRIAATFVAAASLLGPILQIPKIFGHKKVTTADEIASTEGSAGMDVAQLKKLLQDLETERKRKSDERLAAKQAAEKKEKEERELAAKLPPPETIARAIGERTPAAEQPQPAVIDLAAFRGHFQTYLSSIAGELRQILDDAALDEAAQTRKANALIVGKFFAVFSLHPEGRLLIWDGHEPDLTQFAQQFGYDASDAGVRMGLAKAIRQTLEERFNDPAFRIPMYRTNDNGPGEKLTTGYRYDAPVGPDTSNELSYGDLVFLLRDLAMPPGQLAQGNRLHTPDGTQIADNRGQAAGAVAANKGGLSDRLAAIRARLSGARQLPAGPPAAASPEMIARNAGIKSIVTDARIGRGDFAYTDPWGKKGTFRELVNQGIPAIAVIVNRDSSKSAEAVKTTERLKEKYPELMVFVFWSQDVKAGLAPQLKGRNKSGLRGFFDSIGTSLAETFGDGDFRVLFGNEKEPVNEMPNENEIASAVERYRSRHPANAEPQPASVDAKQAPGSGQAAQGPAAGSPAQVGTAAAQDKITKESILEQLKAKGLEFHYSESGRGIEDDLIEGKIVIVKFTMESWTPCKKAEEQTLGPLAEKYSERLAIHRLWKHQTPKRILDAYGAFAGTDTGSIEGFPHFFAFRMSGNQVEPVNLDHNWKALGTKIDGWMSEAAAVPQPSGRAAPADRVTPPTQTTETGMPPVAQPPAGETTPSAQPAEAGQKAKINLVNVQQYQGFNDRIKSAGGKSLFELLAEGKTVMIKFGAPWCGPCRSLGPKLKALMHSSQRNPWIKGVVFEDINTDVEGHRSKPYGVDGIPQTFIWSVTSNGTIVKKQFTGDAFDEIKPYLRSVVRSELREASAPDTGVAMTRREFSIRAVLGTIGLWLYRTLGPLARLPRIAAVLTALGVVLPLDVPPVLVNYYDTVAQLEAAEAKKPGGISFISPEVQASLNEIQGWIDNVRIMQARQAGPRGFTHGMSDLGIPLAVQSDNYGAVFSVLKFAEMDDPAVAKVYASLYESLEKAYPKILDSYPQAELYLERTPLAELKANLAVDGIAGLEEIKFRFRIRQGEQGQPDYETMIGILQLMKIALVKDSQGEFDERFKQFREDRWDEFSPKINGALKTIASAFGGRNVNDPEIRKALAELRAFYAPAATGAEAILMSADSLPNSYNNGVMIRSFNIDCMIGMGKLWSMDPYSLDFRPGQVRDILLLVEMDITDLGKRIGRESMRGKIYGISTNSGDPNSTQGEGGRATGTMFGASGLIPTPFQTAGLGIGDGFTGFGWSRSHGAPAGKRFLSEEEEAGFFALLRKKYSFASNSTDEGLRSWTKKMLETALHELWHVLLFQLNLPQSESGPCLIGAALIPGFYQHAMHILSNSRGEAGVGVYNRILEYVSSGERRAELVKTYGKAYAKEPVVERGQVVPLEVLFRDPQKLPDEIGRQFLLKDFWPNYRKVFPNWRESLGPTPPPLDSSKVRIITMYGFRRGDGTKLGASQRILPGVRNDEAIRFWDSANRDEMRQVTRRTMLAVTAAATFLSPFVDPVSTSGPLGMGAGIAGEAKLKRPESLMNPKQARTMKEWQSWLVLSAYALGYPQEKERVEEAFKFVGANVRVEGKEVEARDASGTTRRMIQEGRFRGAFNHAMADWGVPIRVFDGHYVLVFMDHPRWQNQRDGFTAEDLYFNLGQAFQVLEKRNPDCVVEQSNSSPSEWMQVIGQLNRFIESRGNNPTEPFEPFGIWRYNPAPDQQQQVNYKQMQNFMTDVAAAMLDNAAAEFNQLSVAARQQVIAESQDYVKKNIKAFFIACGWTPGGFDRRRINQAEIDNHIKYTRTHISSLLSSGLQLTAQRLTGRLSAEAADQWWKKCNVNFFAPLGMIIGISPMVPDKQNDQPVAWKIKASIVVDVDALGVGTYRTNLPSFEVAYLGGIPGYLHGGALGVTNLSGFNGNTDTAPAGISDYKGIADETRLQMYMNMDGVKQIADEKVRRYYAYKWLSALVLLHEDWHAILDARGLSPRLDDPQRGSYWNEFYTNMSLIYLFWMFPDEFAKGIYTHKTMVDCMQIELVRDKKAPIPANNDPYRDGVAKLVQTMATFAKQMGYADPSAFKSVFEALKSLTLTQFEKVYLASLEELSKARGGAILPIPPDTVRKAMRWYGPDDVAAGALLNAVRPSEKARVILRQEMRTARPAVDYAARLEQDYRQAFLERFPQYISDRKAKWNDPATSFDDMARGLQGMVSLIVEFMASKTLMLDYATPPSATILSWADQLPDDFLQMYQWRKFNGDQKIGWQGDEATALDTSIAHYRATHGFVALWKNLRNKYSLISTALSVGATVLRGSKKFFFGDFPRTVGTVTAFVLVIFLSSMPGKTSQQVRSNATDLKKAQLLEEPERIRLETEKAKLEQIIAAEEEQAANEPPAAPKPPPHFFKPGDVAPEFSGIPLQKTAAAGQEATAVSFTEWGKRFDKANVYFGDAANIAANQDLATLLAIAEDNPSTGAVIVLANLDKLPKGEREKLEAAIFAAQLKVDGGGNLLVIGDTIVEENWGKEFKIRDNTFERRDLKGPFVCELAYDPQTKGWKITAVNSTDPEHPDQSQIVLPQPPREPESSGYGLGFVQHRLDVLRNQLEALTGLRESWTEEGLRRQLPDLISPFVVRNGKLEIVAPENVPAEWKKGVSAEFLTDLLQKAMATAFPQGVALDASAPIGDFAKTLSDALPKIQAAIPAVKAIVPAPLPDLSTEAGVGMARGFPKALGYGVEHPKFWGFDQSTGEITTETGEKIKLTDLVKRQGACLVMFAGLQGNVGREQVMGRIDALHQLWTTYGERGLQIIIVGEVMPNAKVGSNPFARFGIPFVLDRNMSVRKALLKQGEQAIPYQGFFVPEEQPDGSIVLVNKLPIEQRSSALTIDSDAYGTVLKYMEAMLAGVAVPAAGPTAPIPAANQAQDAAKPAAPKAATAPTPKVPGVSPLIGTPGETVTKVYPTHGVKIERKPDGSSSIDFKVVTPEGEKSFWEAIKGRPTIVVSGHMSHRQMAAIREKVTGLWNKYGNVGLQVVLIRPGTRSTQDQANAYLAQLGDVGVPVIYNEGDEAVRFFGSKSEPRPDNPRMQIYAPSIIFIDNNARRFKGLPSDEQIQANLPQKPASAPAAAEGKKPAKAEQKPAPPVGEAAPLETQSKAAPAEAAPPAAGERKDLAATETSSAAAPTSSRATGPKVNFNGVTPNGSAIQPGESRIGMPGQVVWRAYTTQGMTNGPEGLGFEIHAPNGAVVPLSRAAAGRMLIVVVGQVSSPGMGQILPELTGLWTKYGNSGIEAMILRPGEGADIDTINRDLKEYSDSGTPVRIPYLVAEPGLAAAFGNDQDQPTGLPEGTVVTPRIFILRPGHDTFERVDQLPSDAEVAAILAGKGLPETDKTAASRSIESASTTFYLGTRVGNGNPVMHARLRAITERLRQEMRIGGEGAILMDRPQTSIDAVLSVAMDVTRGIYPVAMMAVSAVAGLAIEILQILRDMTAQVQIEVPLDERELQAVAQFAESLDATQLLDGPVNLIVADENPAPEVVVARIAALAKTYNQRGSAQESITFLRPEGKPLFHIIREAGAAAAGILSLFRNGNISPVRAPYLHELSADNASIANAIKRQIAADEKSATATAVFVANSRLRTDLSANAVVVTDADNVKPSLRAQFQRFGDRMVMRAAQLLEAVPLDERQARLTETLVRSGLGFEVDTEGVLTWSVSQFIVKVQEMMRAEERVGAAA